MITTRAEKGAVLTHDELDDNFKACENLKGMIPPTPDQGFDGDTYVLYAHDVESDSSTFLLTLEDVTGSYEYNLAGLIGTSEFVNDVEYFTVNTTTKEITIQFTDNVAKMSSWLRVYTFEVDLSTAYNVTNDDFVINYVDLADDILARSPMTFQIELFNKTAVDQTSYVKTRGTWAENDPSTFGIFLTLPVPDLTWFKKSIYVIDDAAEYVCVANTLTPLDADCFWLQR